MRQIFPRLMFESCMQMRRPENAWHVQKVLDDALSTRVVYGIGISRILLPDLP
jgi:hypothetical protein